MKTLDRYILKSYLSPFVRSFLIGMFLLLLQFWYTYKDDLLGKGLSYTVLGKILLYASASMVILALPIAVLMGGLLAGGSWGEHYELSAMKAGGVSLGRIMRPLTFIAVFITLLSWSFSVYISPEANLKLYSLIYDVSNVKPEFSLKPGVFNTEIDHYAIRIEDKDVDRNMLFRIMIYDHTAAGNDRMILADSGRMYTHPDQLAMHMVLYSGASYQTWSNVKQRRKSGGEDKYSFLRFKFDTLRYNFDLKDFGLHRTDETEFSSHQYTMNLGQLEKAMDSVDVRLTELKAEFKMRMDAITHLTPSMEADTQTVPMQHYRGENVLSNFPQGKREDVMKKALENARTAERLAEKGVDAFDYERTSRREYAIEYHGKFALPLSCLIFMFIGVPLGAIIRKGGLGMPALFSLGLYVTFYILMIQGRELAREGVTQVWFGTWLPILVMAPLSIFLTYEAAMESRVLNADWWWRHTRLLRKVLNRINFFPWFWRYRWVRRVVRLGSIPFLWILPSARAKRQLALNIRRAQDDEDAMSAMTPQPTAHPRHQPDEPQHTDSES